MENIGVLVFIDANCYLDFYRIPRGKSLLTFLLEQQDYIFITKQIVEEVQRNKLQEAKRFLTKLPEKLAEPDVPIPDHLLKIPGKTADNLHKTLEAIKQKIQSVKANLKKATVETLKAISSSEDEVSKALAPLFDRAVAHTPEEIHRARDRKERGNPPGKQKDSLGDQLTWEQLLSHCKGKFKLWVISMDSDYCIKHDDMRFLNPFLYEDLM